MYLLPPAGSFDVPAKPQVLWRQLLGLTEVKGRLSNGRHRLLNLSSIFIHHTFFSWLSAMNACFLHMSSRVTVVQLLFSLS